MRIFTENVEFISTSGDKNILQIEKYEEVFFDVYEISIHGKKFVSEKIGEYDKNPIVKIPVEIDGIKKDYPFILHEGKFQIVFNEKNELIQEYAEEEIPIITEEVEEVEEYSKESFEKELIDIQEKKHKILEYIENVKKTAKQQTDEYNKNQLKILEQQKEQNKKELQSLLESSKESWFQEFVDTSNKIKKELFDRLNINNSEIYESIDLKLEVISDDFKKLINEDFSNTEKIFENKIKELITEIYNNQVIKVINDGIDKISEQSEISFENIKNDFNAALSEKANDTDLKNVENKLENEILSIQKESIELHDLISKTASSNQKSINFIENKIDETQIELKESIVKIIDEKIEENEDNITTYYNEKLDIVENKLIDLSDENRQYFIGLINESRDNLLKEIKSIKENKAIEYIVENKKTGEKKEIDINSIKSDLQKEISNKISNEIIALRKYTAYHSGGGGTVAQQFADGGTMNGSLNINGQILSGGVDIATLFSGGGSADRLVNGSYQVLLSGNGDLIFPDGTTQTTAFTNNLSAYATLNHLNSNFLNLSGGTITGDTRFNSNVTIFGNLTATGTTKFNNTIFSVTSALSVVHIGEGPAMWVGNSGQGDIASFNDIDTGIEVLHIGGSNGSFPNVGVKTSTPNKTLTVVGEISSTSDITTSGSIGIGTPTPNERLTVSGNISASGTVTADTIDFSNSTSFLQTSNDVRSWYEYGIGPSIPVSETAPSGLFFKPDGLVVYIIGFSLDLVRSFALTTPWDITTQSNTASSTLLVTAAEATPQDLHFSPDGVYLFIVGQNNDRVYRFTLSTPWDITTAVYDGIANALSVLDKETTPLGLTMSNDGTRLYVCGADSDNIDQYNLTTSWSLSTAVHAHTINIAAQETSPNALAFNSNGTRLYVTGSAGDDITEYRLATPWEISTASYFSESFTILTETAPTGLFINSLTNDAYLIGSTLDRVLQFKTDRQLNYNGDSFVMDSQLYVGGRAEFKNTLYANSNANIIGSLVVGNNITGSGLTTTGTTTLANTNNAVTVSIATGATALAKTILIGTNSRFTSPTNVTIGSLDDSGGTTFQHPVRLNKNAIFDNAITVKGSFDPISSAAVATGAIAISDTFTEATDTLLQNHIPNIGTSWSRIQVNSATTSFTIEASTDTLKPTATAADNGVIYIENTTLTNPDYEVSVDLPVQASSDDVIWLIARYQDVNNFYGVRWSTTAANCTLYKRVGGTFTQLGVTPYINPATGSSNLSLRVVGNRIAVVNGGQTKIAFTDDSLTAAGKAGLAGGNIGVLSTDDLINTWRLDNFKVQYYTDAASTFEKGDVAINNGGLILKSPNGTSYKLTVNDDGSLQTTAI